MSRLDELIAELCPAGVEYKKLEDVATYANIRIPVSMVNSNTYVGVENLLPNKQGKTISNSVPKEGVVIQFYSGDILIGNIRPYLRKIWLADCDGGTNGDVLTIQIKRKTEIFPSYLYYVLSSEAFFVYDVQYSKGAKMPRGSKDAVMNYRLPVPPLPVQQEIVRILDHFTELTAELQKLLTKEEQLFSVKQKYYLNKLVSSNIQYETRQLRDLMKVRMCKRIQKNQTVLKGSIPFYKNGTLGKEADTYIPVELYEEYKAKYPYPEKGAVMLSTAGTVGRAWIFDGKPAYFQDSNVVWLENDEDFVSNEYLYWFCLSMPWKLPSRGTIKHLHNDMILDTYISVPPLHIQNDCISFLKAAINNFELMRESLLSEISIRQKQYEYYHDKLLSFPEKG